MLKATSQKRLAEGQKRQLRAVFIRAAMSGVAGLYAFSWFDCGLICKQTKAILQHARWRDFKVVSFPGRGVKQCI
jgi:hypothetical protein